MSPGYPSPAPEMIDGSQTWNAFSPPQAPQPPGGGVGGAPGASAGVYGVPAPYGQPGAVQSFQPVSPYGQDPFLGQAPSPYGAPQGFTRPGANGPRPYRLGWQSRLDVHWMPSENVSRGGAVGEFGVLATDLELQWTQDMGGWIFISSPQFGLRNWSGPGGVSLPGEVYRLGWDLRMETPMSAQNWGFMAAFNPSINSDFSGSAGSEAWNLDARGAFLFQLDPYWQMIVGMQYWDRVNDQLLPYAGFVYTDDFWEWRLTYPEARISLFLGNEYMWSKWLYVRAEYHVEAYEVDTTFGGVQNRQQVELEDWRALIGLRMDTGYYDWFLEGGWVFGRNVDFAGATPSFDIDTGFIGQVGIRF